jgi:tetratricopeptide (TPR) repeat protein
MDSAAGLGRPDLAAELALNLCPFFARRGYSAERLERATAGLEAARAAFAGDHHVTAGMHHQLGWCYFDRGDYLRAMKYVDRSRRDAGATGITDHRSDRTRHAPPLDGIRAQHRRPGAEGCGKFADAAAASDRAVDLIRRSGDAAGIGHVLNNVGVDAMQAGRNQVAQRLFEEAEQGGARRRRFPARCQDSKQPGRPVRAAR